MAYCWVCLRTTITVGFSYHPAPSTDCSRPHLHNQGSNLQKSNPCAYLASESTSCSALMCLREHMVLTLLVSFALYAVQQWHTNCVCAVYNMFANLFLPSIYSSLPPPVRHYGRPNNEPKRRTNHGNRKQRHLGHIGRPPSPSHILAKGVSHDYRQEAEVNRRKMYQARPVEVIRIAFPRGWVCASQHVQERVGWRSG